jgi:hypothetical protein
MDKRDLNLTSTRNNTALTNGTYQSVGTSDVIALDESFRKAPVYVEPSHAIAQGMSTAIVVHSSYQKSRFLSSAIWEILKRIVGLSRAPTMNRSNSKNDAGISNRHIMTV